MDSPPRPPRTTDSWSIYDRTDINHRYEIVDKVGSGAYSDVYRARRRSDGAAVALKEIHDTQSALREIEALQALSSSPNVIELIEYFWDAEADDDAVLVLEFLPLDLASVIADAKRSGEGIPAGEVKQWILQILRGVDACHRNGLVHRDLKPSNLLVSAEGVLKLADFGQARTLQEARYISREITSHAQISEHEASLPQGSIVEEVKQSPSNASHIAQDTRPTLEDEYLRDLYNIKAKHPMDDTDKDFSLQDGDTSCLATCSTGDMEDPFEDPYMYEAADSDGGSGALTCFVGTRWFKAPELLYGSTNYGQEIDLWSLGCVIAELLGLQPLFPGDSDIGQIGKIIGVLGDMNEETWPGCYKLPDYNKLVFSKVENPIGLEACLPNRSPEEINIVRRLLCYDPASRATAIELLQDKYFHEEPLPVPLIELRVPSKKDVHDESSREWGDFKDLGSDSDPEFSSVDVTTTAKGFTVRFP